MTYLNEDYDSEEEFCGECGEPIDNCLCDIEVGSGEEEFDEI